MRHLRTLAVLGLSAVVAASGCGDLLQPREAGPEIDPADTAQTRGTLLTSGESVPYWSELVWVPGTDLVAFTSSSPTGGGCAIKTVDAASGSTGIVDAHCMNLYSHTEAYFRRLVAAPDGGALYYTVGIGDPTNLEWVLRMANPAGSDTSTLRSGMVGAAMAVSPDGQHLAYLATRNSEDDSDSLIVRDLSSGVENHYFHHGTGRPILFSPDGSELLYHEESPWPVTLRRLSLGDGTNQRMSLPDTLHARLFHWGASGIEVLTELIYPSEFHVLNLTTGESVRVGSIQQGEGGPFEALGSSFLTWSNDGTHVAYWIGRCFDWEHFLGGDCLLGRSALHVADTGAGTWVRVAYTSGGSGPTVFSPDGTQLVYHDSEGDFYVVEVP